MPIERAEPVRSGVGLGPPDAIPDVLPSIASARLGRRHRRPGRWPPLIRIGMPSSPRSTACPGARVAPGPPGSRSGTAGTAPLALADGRGAGHRPGEPRGARRDTAPRTVLDAGERGATPAWHSSRNNISTSPLLTPASASSSWTSKWSYQFRRVDTLRKRPELGPLPSARPPRNNGLEWRRRSARSAIGWGLQAARDRGHGGTSLLRDDPPVAASGSRSGVSSAETSGSSTSGCPMASRESGRSTSDMS